MSRTEASILVVTNVVESVSVGLLTGGR